MDPISALGVASGVIAVLQMTGTLISQGYSHFAALKNAPEDLLALIQELSSLNHILSALKIQLEAAQATQNNHRLSALELLNKPGGPIDPCKKILDRVKKRLDKLNDRKLGSYLVGPSQDKLIRQDIEQLERLKSVFLLALNSDQMTLSKAIEDYLRKTLEDYKKEQQVLGKRIRDTDDNVTELCRVSKRREIEGKVAHDQLQKALNKSAKNQETLGKHARDTHKDVVGLCLEVERQIDKEKERREEERRNIILKWLFEVDYLSNHHAACNLQQPGTGIWFVEGQDFKRWQDTAGLILWLHGIPGAGKTILTSTTIQAIHSVHGNPPSDEIAIIYFYFDFKDKEKQTTTGMLRSLIHQLLGKLRKIPEEANALFEKHGNNEKMRPTLPELIELLKVILAYFTKCFIVIDALDECNERQTLLSTIDTLIKTGGLQKTSVLLTSRKEHDIETSFLKHPIITPVLIQNNNVDVDVNLYVEESIGKDELLRKFSQELKKDIRTTLVRGSRGMFRWVKCQLDSIRGLKRPKAIRDALRSLPKTLDDTYDRILLNIRADDDKELMRRALQLVVYAIRPMTLVEVAEAVVVEEGAESLELDNRFIEPEYLLSICGSLFSVSGGDLGLAHYSIQEYLQSERIRIGPASMFAMDETKAAMEISKICLTYLGFDDFETGISLSRDELYTRHKSYPLLDYAAQYWHKHVTSEAVEENIIEIAKRVWGPKSTSKYMVWRQNFEDRIQMYQLYLPLDPDLFSLSTYRNLSTLLHPVIWGFHILTRNLLEMGADCDALDTIFDSPQPVLHIAAEKGHVKMVGILLQHGADVNIKGGEYETVLQAAAYKGNEKMVETLLQHGADVNIEGWVRGTALQAAVYNGNEKVVETLLQHGADVNIKGGEYETVLQTAAYGGNEKVVEILLQHGADVNIEGWVRGTALQVAVYNGNEKVVETLLQHGADVNIKGGEYETVLQAAAYKGNEKMVEILLQHGADVNVDGGVYGTALQTAAYGGNEKMVEILLQHGADVNIQGGVRGTALQAAAYNGNEKMVETLLQHGADVNIKGGEYGTALQAAAYNGNEKVVETLLQHGADVNIQGGVRGTALHAAAYNRNEKVVETLLQHGADVNIKGRVPETALQVAAYGGNEKVVEILLQHGADVNIKDWVYGTALQAAAYNGNEKVVETLLQHGADVNIEGGVRGTALQAAAYGGNEKVVETLLQHGADVNITDWVYGTALQAAVYNGNEKMVETLLQHGADVNIEGGEYGTALQAAAYNGNEKVVEILLQHGADANIEGGMYGTALQAAAYNGYEKVVEILERAVTEQNSRDFGSYYLWRE